MGRLAHTFSLKYKQRCFVAKREEGELRATPWSRGTIKTQPAKVFRTPFIRSPFYIDKNKYMR